MATDPSVRSDGDEMVNALLVWHSCEFLKQIFGLFFYCIDTVNGGASTAQVGILLG